MKPYFLALSLSLSFVLSGILPSQTHAQRYSRRSSSYQRQPSNYHPQYSSRHRNSNQNRSRSALQSANQQPEVGPGLPNEPQILPIFEEGEIEQLKQASDLTLQEVESQFDDLAPLSEESRKLRGTIEQLLAANARRPFQTRGNSIEEVIHLCFPYGAESVVYHLSDGKQGGYLYAIGCLCWNYPFKGQRLLRSDGTFPITKMGYGFQKYPSTFLAMLAFSKIDESYELRLEGAEGLTLADLVEGEKYYCSRGDDLSMKLVGLSFYVSPDKKWENSLQEEWSLERIVYEELQRPVDQSCEEVTNQLLGFSAAVGRYQLEDLPLEGPLADAQERLEQYQDFALEIRNGEGGWHPKFFLYKGSGEGFYDQLFANAHILRWLVHSLPEEQLRESSFLRSMAHLTNQVNRISLQTSPASMSTKQIEALTVALHAMSLFHDRLYGRNQQYEAAKASAREAEAKEQADEENADDSEPETDELTGQPPEPAPLEEKETPPADSEEDTSELPQP